MKFTIKIFLIGYLVATVCISLYFSGVLYLQSYKEFIGWVADSLLHKPHIIKVIPHYFSELQFGIIRFVFGLIVVGLFLISYYLIKKWTFINNYLKERFAELAFILRNFLVSVLPYDRWERSIFLMIVILPLLIAGYNIWSIPISYDESVSYIDFISKGPVVIGSLFHTTNNHIFYNYISYTVCLLITDSEIAQRLPLLFIYTANSILLFALLKRLTNPYAALSGLSFFVLSTPVYLYSFMARGYLLVLFFVLLSLWSSYQLLSKSGRRYWLGLYISSVLGMYTISIMAYLLVPLYIGLGFFFLARDKQKLIALIKTAVCSVVTIGLFYMPIILVSGLGALLHVIKDTGTKSNIFTNTGSNVKLFTDFYFSSSIYIKIILSAVFLIGTSISIYYSKRENKFFIYFLLAITILPFLLTTALSQKMFDRTWIYIVVPISIFYSFAFNWIKKRQVALAVILFTLIIQLISSIQNVYLSDQMHQMNAARKASDRFASGKMSRIYINHLYVRPMIEYRLKVLKYDYELNIGSSVFRRVPFDVAKKYDMIVCTNYNKQPEFDSMYVLTDSIKEIRIFERLDGK